MEEQIEEVEEQIEEVEEVEEPIQQKPKKKMTFTPEQLERKQQSMNKARAFKQKNKEELIRLREEVKKKETEPPKPVPEVKKKKTKIIREIVEETESESEEEVIERIIVKKKREPYIREPSNNDLVNLSYREKLQQQLKDEKRQMLMASLFDY